MSQLNPFAREFYPSYCFPPHQQLRQSGAAQQEQGKYGATVINGGDRGLYQIPSVRVTGRKSSQFDFQEDLAKANSPHARTTLMIKHIPNVYSRDLFLRILDRHCTRCNEKSADAEEPLSAYDFFDLPIDFKNGINLGYAFVNFTSARATWKLFEAFHMQPWKCLDSRRTSGKVCEIVYAKVQGRVALESRFKKYSFGGFYAKYSPLVFEPPRNGEKSTEKSVKSRVISHEVQPKERTATFLAEG